MLVKTGVLESSCFFLFLAQDFIIFKEPSIEEFEKMYYSQNGNPECFYAYAESMKARRNGKLADATIDFYDKHIGKMKKFRPELSMGEVDPDFLYAYRDHCIKLKNNENTLNKSLEFVRRVMNAALREGRISKTPFINFPIKNPKGDTAHLTIEELQQLEKKYKEGTLPKACQNVLRYFLFACYTGLRYADVQNLQFTNLVEDKGSNWLHFVQQKTGKQTQVYLMPQAMALIPVQEFKNQRMFRVVPNQTTNRHLKEIALMLEWEKRITFHMARHTCSNLLYHLGIPVEIRSKIVGDTAKVLQEHYTRTDSDMIKKAINDFSEAIAKTAYAP